MPKKFAKFILISSFLFISIGSMSAQAALERTPQDTQTRCNNFYKLLEVVPGKSDTNAVKGYPLYCSAGEIIVKATNILFAFATSVAVVFIIVGGYWYLTSAGNEEGAEKGRKTIVNAVIGLIVIILSWTIVRVINNVLTNDITSGTSTTAPATPAGQEPGGTGASAQPGAQTGGGLTDTELATIAQGISIQTVVGNNIMVESTITPARAELLKKMCGNIGSVAGAAMTVEFKGGGVGQPAGFNQYGQNYKASMSFPAADLGQGGGPLIVYVCGQPLFSKDY